MQQVQYVVKVVMIASYFKQAKNQKHYIKNPKQDPQQILQNLNQDIILSVKQFYYSVLFKFLQFHC